MPRPKEDKKAAAMAAINEHLNLHGPQNWDECMARFPDVSRATFFRWVKEAKETIESQASRQGTVQLKLAQQRIRNSVELSPERTQREVKAHLPAAPSPAIIASMPSDVAHSTFDFLTYFKEIAGDLKMVRDSNVIENDDGTKRAKNPMLMGMNAVQRLRVVETWIKSMELLYSFERNQEFQRLIVEELGKVSPELQQAVLVRMRDLDNRIGLTTMARIR